MKKIKKNGYLLVFTDSLIWEQNFYGVGEKLLVLKVSALVVRHGILASMCYFLKAKLLLKQTIYIGNQVQRVRELKS